jgi:hypothetical protein
VAQADNNKRSKRARVLRAADVIPPFDKDVSPVKEPGNGDKESTPSEASGQQPQREPKVRRTRETGSGGGDRSLAEQPAVVPEIPTYDLGENVLAEHRQAASRRRKAPGQAEMEPQARSEHAAAIAHVVEPPSQDLAELQRIVAEIVARDIERLCRQPSRPPHG